MSDTRTDDCHGILETIPEVEYGLVTELRDIARPAEIIERATRGARTTDGHPMKISDHTARIIAEALADDGALVGDQWEYAVIELRPNGAFNDAPDGYHWSTPQWWHHTEQDALDDLKSEFMQWRYGTSVAARIIRRPKPRAPELVRTLHRNPHHEGDQVRAAAHSFGYTVLRRESDNEEWREA